MMHQGYILVTPNNRLSNQLLSDYYAKYAPLSLMNKKTIKKPCCFPYQTFLHYIFNQIRHLDTKKNHPIVLTSAQQSHLWRQVIGQSAPYPCNAGLLHEVIDAWKRCQYWHIDFNHKSFTHTPQTQHFKQWQRDFQHELNTRNVITEEQLAEYICSNLTFDLQKNIIWTSFDDYTPQQRTLQLAFESFGFSQNHYDLTPKELKSYLYQAQDVQDENNQMLMWIKHRLECGDKRIAVIVPDLQTQASALQRLLQRNLLDTQFNISLGKSLLDFPIIAHALQWLNLDNNQLSNHQARLLLHSPYIKGSKHEFLARADAIQNAKLLKESIIPIDAFVAYYESKMPKLTSILQQIDEYPPSASIVTWIYLFKQRLNTFGFPGDYVLNSSNYQCVQRFLMLFDEFMQLSVITPILSREDAISALLKLAENTIFQLKQPKTPIQVLGLLEASGCTFDSIWMSGLTDQCLPQKLRFSAFIPIDLQREKSMPHASVERELELTKKLLQRLHYASNSLVFSYPRLIGDMPNLPCPLISDIPKYQAIEAKQTQDDLSLISHTEDYIIPWLDNEIISGTTALLANQAKCPFRAFAAHRLNARTPEDVSEGPDAIERGQIIHSIMEELWRHLGSQATLNKMASHELDQLIKDTILATLKPIVKARSVSFSTITQAVEFKRLKLLIKNALEWEKSRPAFIVEAIEQTFTIKLAGIDFKVRVDRLDKILENDELKTQKMVIDYKSSLPSSKPWNEERPEEPQLLLYALLDEHINALLFVQLKAGRLTPSGLSENPTNIKGLQALKKDEHWEDNQKKWQQQLENIACEFKTGICQPQPSRESTCNQCSYLDLCRLGM